MKAGSCLAAGLFFFALLAPAGCRREAPPPEPDNVGEERRDAGLSDYPRLMQETRRTARELEVLLPARQAIEMFHALEGRYPASLDELVEAGYYEQLPTPPAGTNFDYRPETGQLHLVPEAGD